MKIITVYAVVNGSEIITTTKNEAHAQEQCDILNTVNKTIYGYESLSIKKI